MKFAVVNAVTKMTSGILSPKELQEAYHRCIHKLQCHEACLGLNNGLLVDYESLGNAVFKIVTTSNQSKFHSWPVSSQISRLDETTCRPIEYRGPCLYAVNRRAVTIIHRRRLKQWPDLNTQAHGSFQYA